jgi:uncharacterized membrane protein
VGKGRFEAFSDGVFAIAITLLVLEIHLPDAGALSNGQMLEYLAHLWPQLLTYVTSFATIGIIWLNHHSTFVHIERVDRHALALNLVLLLMVCFVPFPTALVAKYGALPASTVLYGATLTAMGLSYGALWFYVVRQECRRNPATALRLDGVTVLKGMAGTGVYFLGTLVAFIAPRLSNFLFVVVAIYYAVPGRLDTARRDKNRSLSRETRVSRTQE